MVGHVEDVKIHEEFPIEKVKKFANFFREESFLWITTIFFAEQLIPSPGNVEDDVHDYAQGLGGDHEVNIVVELSVIIEGIDAGVFSDAEDI